MAVITMSRHQHGKLIAEFWIYASSTTLSIEALQRPRQLIDDGDRHAVTLCDSSGSVLAGILLQLKLGAVIAD